MPAVDFTTPLPPLVIGASGLEAIAQNIRIIVTTLAWSVPLDRAFAHAGAFIDAPTPYAVARKIAELTEAIEANEPRVKVESIRFAARTTKPTAVASGSERIAQTPRAVGLCPPRMEAASERGEDAMQGRLYPVISFSLREGVTL